MIPDVPRLQRLLDRKTETRDTHVFFFENHLEDPMPGQFVQLWVPGAGEVPISISSDPSTQDVLELTVRKAGKVTSKLFEAQIGDKIGIRGPYGRAWPTEELSGKHLLFVAGGIGLAPLRSFIRHALSNRHKYGNIIVFYGDRSPEHLLYGAERQQWVQKGIDLHITVDNPTGNWTGNVGVVTTLFDKRPVDPENMGVLVCGPPIMMHFVGIELEKRGFDQDNVFFTLENHMKCGIGKCGHCRIGSSFVCRDGPVYSMREVREMEAWVAGQVL